MPRAPLIRIMLAVSLGLLAVGAFSPLLTTTSFFVFSSTFSLLTAIRELAAVGHVPLAIVIALFSLCVPVAKAAVLWIAAPGRSADDKLLIVVEKLGKWSMLEVFAAALLIVAVKLGPVADADLHYGAYLLAASVIVAGAASHVLAHEMRLTPLFSSSFTLMIGAVAGAVCATLLIATLNPNALSTEALTQSASTRCIDRVLRIEQTYARASDSDIVYARNLRDIDYARCPETFRLAFLDYVQAWEALVAMDTRADDEPSTLTDRIGGWLGLASTREDLVDDIEDAWSTVEREAITYAVQAPENSRASSR